MPDPASTQDGRLAELLDAESLRDWISKQRWYGAKSRAIAGLEIVEWLSLREDPPLWLTLVQTRFATGTHDLYQLPLLLARSGDDPIATAQGNGASGPIASAGEWSVYDGLADPGQALELLHRVQEGEEITTEHGRFGFASTETLAAIGAQSTARLMGVEQSNSSIVFDDRFVLKVFRKLEPGINPELEMLRFL